MAPKQSDEVTLMLAHPLSAHHAVRLGLEDQDYNVEEEVTLRRDLAQTLINSGYASADSDEVEEVNGALRLRGRDRDAESRDSRDDRDRGRRTEGSFKQPSSADPVPPA